MATVYRITKTLWRKLAPKGIEPVFFGGRTRFSRLIVRGKLWLESRAAHDEVYDEAYFQRQEAQMAQTAEGIADSIHRRFDPPRVVDVGCGSGSVMEALARRGISAVGLEYADAALRLCRNKGLEVHKFDIEAEHDPVVDRAPVVLSTEVAEHLPAAVADRYVALLVKLSTGRVLMTAAPPGQGGTDHVNEQPNEYWIAKFADHGGVYESDLTEQLRSAWHAGGVEPRRAGNIMAFRVDPVGLRSA